MPGLNPVFPDGVNEALAIDIFMPLPASVDGLNSRAALLSKTVSAFSHEKNGYRIELLTCWRHRMGLGLVGWTYRWPLAQTLLPRQHQASLKARSL